MASGAGQEHRETFSGESGEDWGGPSLREVFPAAAVRAVLGSMGLLEFVQVTYCPSLRFSFIANGPRRRKLEWERLLRGRGQRVFGANQVFLLLLFRYYLFIFRQRGREKERERNICVWLPLLRPLLGTWPTTQACAPTGHGTSHDPLVRRRALNPLSHTCQGWTLSSLTSIFIDSLCLVLQEPAVVGDTKRGYL